MKDAGVDAQDATSVVVVAREYAMENVSGVADAASAITGEQSSAKAPTRLSQKQKDIFSLPNVVKRTESQVTQLKLWSPQLDPRQQQLARHLVLTSTVAFLATSRLR